MIVHRRFENTSEKLFFRDVDLNNRAHPPLFPRRGSEPLTPASGNKVPLTFSHVYCESAVEVQLSGSCFELREKEGCFMKIGC